MATYTVKTSDGCEFKMIYDPSLPQTPLHFYVGCDDPDEVGWATSPHQAADARNAAHAAQLVQDYLDDGAAVVDVIREED